MPRTADARLRADLLDAIVDSVLETGVAELSLRPLGLAVGSSPRTLLYHFASKERLIAAIYGEAGRRQVRLLEAWAERSAEHDARTLLLSAWQWLSAPRNERLLRLLFEIQSLGLRDKRRFGSLLRANAAAWAAPFAAALEARGFGPDRAKALAVLLVAVLRGLLLDVLASGDRLGAERAFRSFLAAIELPDAPVRRAPA